MERSKGTGDQFYVGNNRGVNGKTRTVQADELIYGSRLSPPGRFGFLDANTRFFTCFNGAATGPHKTSPPRRSSPD